MTALARGTQNPVANLISLPLQNNTNSNVGLNNDVSNVLDIQPVIPADWNASSGNRWVVPFGGGFGEVFRIGDQPMNAQLQAFYNVERSDLSGAWSIRFQLQFLFPK